MRILYIIPEEFNGERWGGVTTYVFSLAKALTRKGLQIAVLTPGKENKKIMYEGVKVFKIVPSQLFFGRLFPAIAFRLGWAWSVVKFVKSKREFSVIEAPEWGSSTLFFPFFGIKAVIRLHRSWWQYINDNVWPITMSDIVIDCFERFCILSASAVTSPTQYMLKKYPLITKILDLKKVSAFVIVNGIEKPAKKFKQVGIKSPFLLATGRIEPGKGSEILLRSFIKITKNFPRLKLAFVGETTNAYIGGRWTDYVDYLKNIAKKYNVDNKIVFVPRQNRRMLFNFYRNCLFFVSASVGNENCSMSIIEALSVGKAVVGSATGGTVELIKNYKNGLLFRPGDTADLAKKLKILITDNNLRAGFEGYSLKNVRDLRIDLLADKFLKIYETVR